MDQDNFFSLIFNKKTGLNLLVVCLLSYFVFHSVYGNRGIIAYFKLQAEMENAYSKLARLKSERLMMENKTKLLRPESLDLDMLDEKARAILGVARPEEKILNIEQ